VSQIAAIALLALRNALRSRVILVLLALVLAAELLLPLAIRSDGTPEGLIRLHLAYTLGIASFLLTLSTLWAGCAAISQEADDKTLQLLLVKPVPRLRIWLGKWLALLLVDALLLALVGALSVATLRIQIRRAGFDADALSAARQTTLASLQTLRAPLPDIEAGVRAEVETLRARRALPENASEAAVLDSIRHAQLARLYSIAAGNSRTWTFDLPRAKAGAAQPLLVQFKCDSSVPGAADLRAALELQVDDQQFSRDLLAMPGTVQTFVFNGIRPGAARASVAFANQGTRKATLFFDPADGLVLRQPRGTFAGNYLRALGQLYLRLALFAAIGVTLGTLFSMPVAAFLALVLILILQLSGFVSAAAQVDRATFVANVAPFGDAAHAHGESGAPAEAAPSLAARAAAIVLFYTYRGTYLALRPLLEDRTLDDLSAGTRIPPRELLRNALQQGLGLPFILAILSAAVLRKREWALPPAA
jgi:hypothetical protein